MPTDERPRRHSAPSAKQKEIDASRAARVAAAAAKRDKVQDKAPSRVEKRREAITGSFTSKTVELSKAPTASSRNSKGAEQRPATHESGPSHSEAPRKRLPSTADSTQRQRPAQRPQSLHEAGANKENVPLRAMALAPAFQLHRPVPQPASHADTARPSQRRPSTGEGAPSLPNRRRHSYSPLPPSDPWSDEEEQELLDDPYADEPEDSELGPPYGDIFDPDNEDEDEDGADSIPIVNSDDEAPGADAQASNGAGIERTRDSASRSTNVERVTGSDHAPQPQPQQRKRGRISDGKTSATQPPKLPRVQKIAQRDGRARRKDFDEESQSIINLCTDIYEASLASECLFPDTATESRFVKQAWEGACTELRQEFSITPEVFKIITRRGSHFRSESKKIVRLVVAQEYGFKSGQSDSAKTANIALAAKLKNNLGFVRPLPQLALPLEQRTGLYQNRAIGQFINLALFKKKNALGVTQASHFGTALPKATVAYAIVMLEFGISEWTTGCYVDTTFYELDWRKVYFDHLLDLKDFDEATTGVKLYERIAKKLLSNGRVHAGVGPVSGTRSIGRISARVLENELRAFEDGDLPSDDDSPPQPAEGGEDNVPA